MRANWTKWLAVAGGALMVSCSSGSSGPPALAITPAAPSVAPSGSQSFSASGGSGAGYAWSLATNSSGGSINATTGAYTAGATPNVTDVVRVTDSGANVASASVTVTAGISISPATASVAPRASQAFTATGGSGTGFSWALATNASGGSIVAATGVYTAGATPNATDVVRVTDSLGNAATRDVSVTAGVSISPATASVAPRASQAFAATGGSGTGFSWSLVTNASGGSIVAATGVYTAGTSGSVTDVVQVADPVGNTATRNVTVGPGVSITPSSVGVAPGGSRTFAASGGSGTGYAWSLATNASGGSINATTGAYTAGATPNVTDAIRVTDSLGNVGTASAIVTASITITAPSTTTPPRGAIAFSATGGTGTGYSWSLATNASGGSINATTGAYVAGATPSVTDVVRVADSGANVASVSVTVTAGVTISPASAVVRRTGTQAFSASGGAGGFTWSLATNASGGGIVAGTGAYTAGSTAGTDVVRVTDSLGNTRTANVTVTPTVTISPADPVTVLAGASQTFTAGGGSGAGYQWSVTTSASGGTIVAATGVYTAGGVAGQDVITLTDSVGNTATRNVTVRLPITITPASASIFQGGTQAFSASGGSGGFTWSLPTNNSGGSIDPTTGAYTAGVTGGVTDVVRVTDSVSTVAEATVTVLSYVVQRWQVPATWGGTVNSFWANSEAGLVQHATFNDVLAVPVEGGAIAWGVAGSGSIPQSPFTGFANPVVTRYGAGPFPGTDVPPPGTPVFDATVFQATGNDSALDLGGNMLVCAVVKPDYNPIEDGHERVIIGKGRQAVGGWVLMQMHESFCFHYEGLVTPDNMAFTGTWVPTTAPGQGPHNVSFVVVCGGRDDTDPAAPLIRVAANGIESLRSVQLAPNEPMVLSSDRATIGGYVDRSGNHRFGGTVYETAVWSIPATAANIQAKMAAVLGLNLPDGSVAQYTRNHEGPFIGADGNYHTAWRHGPRIDATKGFLFGLQGVNKVVNVEPTSRLGGTLPEALALWDTGGGATVDPNVRVPPGDSGMLSADRVVLPAGASISAQLANFIEPIPVGQVSPLYGQIWIYIDTAGGDSTTGTLRVRTTVPDGANPPVDMGHHDIALDGLAQNQWVRVWLGSPSGLTTDGKLLPTERATLLLENPSGTTPIQVTAWGVDVAQYGGWAGVPAGFDPGIYFYDSLRGSDAADVLQLPVVPASTAGNGFCIRADASTASGLEWTGAFSHTRYLFHWNNGLAGPAAQSVLMFAGAAAGVPGNFVFRVESDALTKALVVPAPPTWVTGSPHTLKGCVTADGAMRVYGDDVLLGTSTLNPLQPVPDLGAGQTWVGATVGGSFPWNGWISRVLACRFTGDPATCQ